jgi:asparagine synthase (glutamine-hydrolysing)
MSGICGVVDFAAPRLDGGVLRRMAESSAYRGPDGIRYRFSGSAGLAHLALQSTAESALAEQPLFDDESQVCVVLDGRFDNRSELAGLLPAFVPLDLISDARLLLAAYSRWGDACAEHLLGDFAFALWDARRHQFLCAVDPVGVKPLHFTRQGSLFCFASDALQILQHPRVSRDLNKASIAAYLGNEAEEPGQSFFKAVQRLRPGHRLVISESSTLPERYWPPELEEIRYRRDEDYAAHFRELLGPAVADRLRTPANCIGVAMSGGLDSTSVAALAQRSLLSSGRSVRAFSLVFESLFDCDERAYSRIMSHELGVDLETIDAERYWTLEDEEDSPYSPDNPVIGWRTLYAQIHRSLRTRKARVLLMGHGADDLLRGSPLIYAERLRRGDLRALFEVIRRFRERGDPIWQGCYKYLGKPLLPRELDRILRVALRKQSPPTPPWVHPDFLQPVESLRKTAGIPPDRHFGGMARRDIYANIVATPCYDRIVNWHDRNAAVFGVEVRHPFLDRRLFEYVLAIPPEQLFRLGSYKNLLRRSMVGVLPEVIRCRKDKTRFVSFLDYLLREKESARIDELLSVPRSEALGIVDGKKLRESYRSYRAGRADEWRRDLWYAITVELWLRRCERKPQAIGREEVVAESFV